MRQENRFVAQLFHYIAPFVDMERDLFICVDGGAAKHHAGRAGSPLADPDVPDLWFSLVGSERGLGVEAKVKENHRISVRQSQIRAWRTDGKGSYKPSFWVATNRELTEFFCWRHSKLVPLLDVSKGKTADVSIPVAKCTPDFHSASIPELALFLLTHAKST